MHTGQGPPALRMGSIPAGTPVAFLPYLAEYGFSGAQNGVVLDSGEKGWMWVIWGSRIALVTPEQLFVL